MAYFIEMIYNDDSTFSFEVTFPNKEDESAAALMMITRGTLMVSGACRANCYNEEGFEVCAYIK